MDFMLQYFFFSLIVSTALGQEILCMILP